MYIKSTKNTPMVNLSVEECKIEIKGSSYSEDANEIYDNVFNWIIEKVPEMTCNPVFIFDLYILSSISEKKILLIISELNKMYGAGKKIKIIWYVQEDEENSEFAEDIADLFKLPVEIIHKS